MSHHASRTGLFGCIFMLLAASNAFATESVALVDSSRVIPVWWWVAPGAGVAALAMAFYFYKSILKASPGNARMQEIAGYVREGAYAYLRRQYRVVGLVFLVLVALLSFMAFYLGVQHRLVPFAFLTGGLFSGLAGFIGMKTATAAASRTAEGARTSVDKGLRIAFRAGAVMGLTVVGLALIDITAWFVYLYKYHHVFFGGHPMNLETITVVMLCFGMGASTQALFARVGGGIYTKAADVGADLVGKIEAGIPEDDPRNPATIADNVGDNVGDVAGMGADLYESYAGAILATAALGVAAATVSGWDSARTFAYLAAPMMLAGLGILFSILGIFVVRARDNASMKNLLAALNRGIYLSSVLILVGAYILVRFLEMPMGVFWAIVDGVVLGVIIGKSTEYATSADFRPTRYIADQAATGPATVIIGGISEGLLSTWIPVLAVCVGTLLAYSVTGGFADLLGGLYGIGIAAVGMLSTLGITLATDAYGPIADNAGGNAEMSYLPKEVRQRTDALDSLGNTTAAIGKGFAIGSAALTALALLASYVEEVRVGIHREVAAAYVAPSDSAQFALREIGHGKFGIYFAGADETRESKQFHSISAFASYGENTIRLLDPTTSQEQRLVVVEIGERLKKSAMTDADGHLIVAGKAGLDDFMRFYNVTLMNPKVIVGIFLGVLLVFVFSALTMKAVGRAAYAMVQEVRRQFAEKPGIMEGKDLPDYARCVAISTAGAQREMIVPSVIAIAAPVAAGLVLNISGVLGLLVGGLCAGFSMAVFMANAGGAWDNAKKFIEAGNMGGKGSQPHKAAVVGDTVGDPFKDTCGPSLNILIKLMTMVSIVFAGLIVKYAPAIGEWLRLGN